MKVAIRDLKPNPFRHLESYPIDQAKVDRLRKSFKHTGFWDNLVARNNKGKIEIAYGHHRLAALKKEYPAKYEVSVIIKPLDDASMIKVMADENDELYTMSPAVVNETVKVARDYLRKHPNEVAELKTALKGRNQYKSTEGIRQYIAEFLAWDKHKIHEALDALSDIEGGHIDKEVYESFSTQHTADEFRTAVKKSNIPKEAHARLAKDLQKPDREKMSIRKAVLEEKYKKKKQDKVDLVEYIYKEIRPLVENLDKKLQELDKHKKFINGANGYLFWSSCTRLEGTLHKFLHMKEVKLQLTKEIK